MHTALAQAAGTAARPSSHHAHQQQLELGFSSSYEVVPMPGRTDVFHVRVSLTPRLGERRLSTADVADCLGLSIRQAGRLMASGRIPCHCPGLRHRRVYQRDLDAYRRAQGIAV